MEELDLVTLIRWLGTATAIVGAVIVSLRLSPRLTGLGFVVFLVSSTSWVAAGSMSGTYSLVAQNGVLTVINLVGIYRWLILKG